MLRLSPSLLLVFATGCCCGPCAAVKGPAGQNEKGPTSGRVTVTGRLESAGTSGHDFMDAMKNGPKDTTRIGLTLIVTHSNVEYIYECMTVPMTAAEIDHFAIDAKQNQDVTVEGEDATPPNMGASRILTNCKIVRVTRR